MEIRFYYDVVCPYAYLASTRIEALAARRGAELVWVPVLLGGLFRHVNSPQLPAAQMSAPRARLNLQDMHRYADLWGVPLHLPAAHPRRSVAAMRLIVAAPAARRPALSADLFAAYWVRGEDISDRAVLGRIAAAHGVSLASIDTPAVKEALFATTAEAASRGAFGVPTFAVGDRIWWGQDRMHLVEAALGGATGPTPSPRGAGGAVIRFFHDFSSPFSYLGSTQVARVAAEVGAEVEWTPILLGGLFRALGTPDVPMNVMNPAKRRYQARDLTDWAGWWGVPFQFPQAFPLRTVLPLRVALREPAATLPLYRAAWAEDRDIGDPRVCAAVLDAAGFDGAALVAGAADPAIKARLRANTEAAQAAGACGVPTFEVRGPEAPPMLIWGQDRLDLVAAAARGWRPTHEAS